MQKREWKAFLQDCVVDATEFTSRTVCKLSRDINDLREVGTLTPSGLRAQPHAARGYAPPPRRLRSLTWPHARGRS